MLALVCGPNKGQWSEDGGGSPPQSNGVKKSSSDGRLKSGVKIFLSPSSHKLQLCVNSIGEYWAIRIRPYVGYVGLSPFVMKMGVDLPRKHWSEEVPLCGGPNQWSEENM